MTFDVRLCRDWADVAISETWLLVVESAMESICLRYDSVSVCDVESVVHRVEEKARRCCRRRGTDGTSVTEVDAVVYES